VNSIKAAWTWLVSEEIVPADSLAAVRSVRALKQGEGGRETGPVAPVEKWVVDATLPYLSPAITNMVKIQRLVGMRSGELVRMRRRDISISPAERIDIPGIDGRKVSAVKVGNTTIWIYCPATHKNLHRRQSRCVAIGPEAQALLGPILMKRLPDEYLFQPAEQIGACGRAMIAAGQFYGVRAYARAIARAVERANRDREERNARVTAGGTSEEEPLIPKWRPGQLRHNAAETAADQVGADEAAAMLGHAASRRAIDSYVQASILRAAETAAKVG
jgi:integrase